MKDELIYLDTYILQQDMRIRLPKSILTNLDVKKGKGTHIDEKPGCGRDDPVP